MWYWVLQVRLKPVVTWDAVISIFWNVTYKKAEDLVLGNVNWEQSFGLEQDCRRLFNNADFDERSCNKLRAEIGTPVGLNWRAAASKIVRNFLISAFKIELFQVLNSW